jgi:NAD(P)-dependent dehydrogenase (short-subunit alcohol dehydrogenase family)
MSVQQGPLDLAELRGTIAVVTGAGNNGIGWGICKHAAQLGMHIVAVDLHANLVKEAQEKLSQAYPDVECIGVQCDVTQPDDLAACLATIQNRWPTTPIGAVFANAGVIFNHTILRSTIEEWTTTLNVNVLGVINTIHAFVPALQEQPSPSVFCTTASIGGLVRGDGGAAAYQASKHAVVALTESLSFELAKRAPHIRIHVLCPCIVASALMQTSAANRRAKSGEFDASDIVAEEPATNGLAMTTERHAQQVFDHIADGNFYMITDNVRPYVDHDYPFDGLGIVRERMDNMLQLQLDNSDAWTSGPNAQPSSILKGPLFQEIKRKLHND